MEESEAVYEAILQCVRQSTPACVLTITEVGGSTPRGVGAKMLLRADGSAVGTIGGGVLEAAALADARQALTEGCSRSVEYSVRAEDEQALGICGGIARIFIEVLRLKPTLLIAGAGHVSQPLAELGYLLGFRTVVVDDRPEYADRAHFPHADELLVSPFEQFAQRTQITPQTFVVIVTRGHQCDDLVLRQVIDTPAAYIGMIGSRKKVASVFARLCDAGVPAAKLARVYAPIGLRTGGQTPAEIALSILAEISLVQHSGTGEPMSWRDNPLRGDVPEGVAA